mmetsp:Transcript_88210/g.238897  ORF Transcript_88210/g.238897 Transcript_88210/m.238897 type:complete len:261 (-) Transcript_88210:106-888(-)
MREHPLDELKLVLPGGVGQRFVDDAAGVLVQGERVEVGAEQAHDVLALLGGAMLEEVLDHEVSIGVLAQVTDVVQQIGDEDCQPLRGKELHQPLKYAAAIWMLRDGTGAAPLEQLRDDEEHVGGPHHRDRLLKHVVRVRGLKRLGDVTLELTHNQLLLGPSCLLQSALHLPAALRLQRQLQDPRAQRRRRRRRRVLRRRRRGRGGGSVLRSRLRAPACLPLQAPLPLTLRLRLLLLRLLLRPPPAGLLLSGQPGPHRECT